ncbi:hypothetical protein [Sphingobacterium puteale]|nr:hypothetical protein [Sphingobacterium puteale]
MKLAPIYSTIALLICFLYSRAQIYESKSNLFQYGMSSSLTIGFKLIKPKNLAENLYAYGNLNFGGSINPDYGGLVAQVGINGTYNFFSSKRKGFAAQVHSTVQAVISPYKAKEMDKLNSYNQPFYSMADLSFPAVKNPYPLSLAIGTGHVLLLSRSGPLSEKTQRVGSVYGKFGNVHIFYQNDGVLPKFMADQKDRWFTSAAMIAWHSNKDYIDINHIQLAYNRFTGYSLGSYELASALNNNMVVYGAPNERQFNMDYFRLGVGLKHNRQLNFNLINSKLRAFQGQKMIHYMRNNPYHPDNSTFHIGVDGTIRSK